MEKTVSISKRRRALYNLVLTALMTAVLAVLSQISIPTPFGVPLTLQTFAVALLAYILGWNYGLFSVGLYLIIGAIGVPVFANFKAGLTALIGPTGGFLIGFLLMALCLGLTRRFNHPLLILLLSVAGLALCHLFGAVWFSFVTALPLLDGFLLSSAPYLIKDILSVILAFFCAAGLNKALRKIQ